MPIDFTGWLTEFRENFREEPGWAIKKAAYYAYLGIFYTVTSRYDPGLNIYEQDWDLLLILDACRVDALREVASEYDFVEDVESVLSVGSTSHEWMSKTFIDSFEQEISETAHVTANGYSYKTFVEGERPPSGGDSPFGWPKWNVVDNSAFAEFHMLWQENHNERLGNVPPRAVTDHAINVSRRSDTDRLLVHYVQPHAPYIRRAIEEDDTPTPIESDPIGALRRGEATKEQIWGLYLDNLRLVLDEVELLLANVDAETVVITSDHGEAFGEHGAYEHPDGFPLAEVKRVPWVETTGSDQKTYTPDTDLSTNRSSGEDLNDHLEEHLHDLGYV